MNDRVQFHSQIASSWESNYTSDVFSVRLKVVDERLAGHDLTGQTSIDAGCGTGTLARFLANHKRSKVLGVDASQEMISGCGPAPKLRRSALLQHSESRFRELLPGSWISCGRCAVLGGTCARTVPNSWPGQPLDVPGR
jgi:SAM-dependent methyltransferase